MERSPSMTSYNESQSEKELIFWQAYTRIKAKPLPECLYSKRKGEFQPYRIRESV